MLRKTLTILSLIGLLLSVGLWGVSYFNWAYGGDRYHWDLERGNVCVERIYGVIIEDGVVKYYPWGPRLITRKGLTEPRCSECGERI